MDDRRSSAWWTLLVLFAGSGAAALIYQLAWGRAIHQVVGSTSGAIATVLSAFMAGLALGGWIGGRVARRIHRPLRVWAGLEAAIGLYALAFPWVLAGWIPAFRWFAESPLLPVVRFAWVAAALLPATIAMGATLPILARFASDATTGIGERIGSLYAANTSGAVFGAAVGGFLLLPELGLGATTRLAAALNRGLALAAAVTDRGVEPEPELPEAAAPLARLATVVGLGGFAALIGEVAWTRVLALVDGPTVYAFAGMLVATLGGLALGGWFGGAVSDRVRPERRMALLAALRFGAGASAFGLLWLCRELPYWYVWTFDLAGGQEIPEGAWLTGIAMAAVVLSPPAFLSGAAFPVAVAAAGGSGAPRATGVLAAAASLGGAAGALIAGFWMLPALHVTGTVAVAAGAEALASLVAAGRSRAAVFGATLGLAVLLVRPPWDQATMTSGMYLYLSRFSDHSRAAIRQSTVSPDMVFYAEGKTSVVTVGINPVTKNIWLANSGKIDASSQGDRPTQVLVGVLPLMHVEQPEHVLTIGLASGMTAGATGLVDSVSRMEVVEMEPAMADAARFYDAHNFGILRDPRLELHFDDATSHVRLARPATWDAVISEPSNPWMVGVAGLYTAEFLAEGRQRLKPGGVWAQWVQVYGLDANALRTVLGTFADTFPYVLLYGIDDMADIVLVGSDHPIRPTMARAEALFANPRAAETLIDIGLREPADLVALYLMDRDRLLEITDGARRNTDDNLRLEYQAPLRLHRDTLTANLRMLRSHALFPEDATNDGLAWAAIAAAYERREEPKWTARAQARAIDLLGPDHPIVQAWLAGDTTAAAP
jgi:spermidine synthase